ncbi:hypothetical protein [Nonomuraea insulae]|uniref:GIY-YIG domain-containing protein n=1 Tax=Nonomuraea insulae TaxID=1616787 RepID=A0ABW1CNT8_9ACTN
MSTPTVFERGWNVPGVYLLLDRPNAEGRWGAYVGTAATSGLRHRVLRQLKDRARIAAGQNMIKARPAGFEPRPSN